MRARGGGIKQIILIDKSNDLNYYFQLSVDFITVDSMGANFINSCLEKISKAFKELILKSKLFTRLRKRN